MAQIKNLKEEIIKLSDEEIVNKIWEQSWKYIKTVTDIVREPVLTLDKDLRVLYANESFYTTFQVEEKKTEKKLVYELGNGQWNIPTLKKLLEDILPSHSFFKGYEVSHEFPHIGKKIMILNAREVHFKEDSISEEFPPIILLAIEDITDMVFIASTFAEATKKLESELKTETKLQDHITRPKKVKTSKKKPLVALL